MAETLPKPNFDLPDPTYDRDVARLVKYYKKAFRLILKRVLTLTEIKKIDRKRAESLIVQIQFILRQLNKEAELWAKEQIRKAFEDGQARAIIALGEADSLSNAAKMASGSMLAREVVEALIADTYQDLLQATQNTERRVKRLVREVVAEQTRLNAIEQMGRKTRVKAIKTELTQKGLSERLKREGWVGIVDKAGRRWDLGTYTEMVTRTKMYQAHVEGTRIEAKERGVDLAIVSSHGAKDPCRYFEGVIISMNGETPGYLTYSELRRTNLIFHPNCKHKITPVRDPNLLPAKVKQKAAGKKAYAERKVEEVKSKAE